MAAYIVFYFHSIVLLSLFRCFQVFVCRSLQPQLIAEAPEAEQLVLVQASPDVRNDVWLEDASLDVDA